jgi:hypothetical protein
VVGLIARSVSLTTRLQVVARLRISGATRLLLPTRFKPQVLCTMSSQYKAKTCYCKKLQSRGSDWPQRTEINPLNAELNAIGHLLALLAHHILHVGRIRVNPLKTKRRLVYLKTQFVPRCKHFSSRL